MVGLSQQQGNLQLDQLCRKIDSDNKSTLQHTHLEFPECRLAFKSKVHMRFSKLEVIMIIMIMEVFPLTKVHLSQVLTPIGAREAYSGLEVEK
jgi:hypothetical protein